MSRRTNNRVRGPTSALTEFLREQGIQARNLTGYATRLMPDDDDDDAQPNQQPPAAGPSNGPSPPPPQPQSDQAEAGPSRPRRATRRDTNTSANGYGSDNLDETDGEKEPSSSKAPAKGKKKSAAAMEKEKEKAKAKAKAEAAAKRRKLNNGDAEYEEDDEYTAPSKGGAIGAMPDIGGFEECAECGKRFTFTKYTRAASPPPGWLCPACTKANGHDPFKKPTAPRRRKTAEEKRKVVSFEEEKAVMSLAEMCLETIGKHIEDVEALGDIGLLNADKIAKIISKNRRLNAATAQLFYDVASEKLTLYDCTGLDPPALITLSNLNPNLQSLRLDFCGRIDAKVIEHWAKHLTRLKRLELLAPFLVTNDGWMNFFVSIGSKLEGFLITNSPRFDEDCLKSLIANCPNLTELRLSRVGQLSDTWLPHLHDFAGLRLLDLSDPSLGNLPISLTDEPVIDLLEAVGQTLETLNLSGNDTLTDAVLERGIGPHTPKLKELYLIELLNLTDDGVASFFNGYPTAPLHTLNLSRNPDLSTNTLSALLDHSGSSLIVLNIDQFKDADTETLMQIPEKAKLLEWLDVGWCRGVDDFVVKALLEGCLYLKELKVFGCNRLTDNCPRKRGVDIAGIESHTI